MMKPFYAYMNKYKGKIKQTDESRLADWMYTTDDFPKFSIDFHEISDFLETYSPFPEALRVFDELWDKYMSDQARGS